MICLTHPGDPATVKKMSTPTKPTATPKAVSIPPKSPGSPHGTLTVTHYNLRKGTPNKYVHKPLKCTMCDQAVNSKN